MRADSSIARFSPYLEDRFRPGLDDTAVLPDPAEQGAAQGDTPQPEAGAAPLPGDSLRALPPPDIAVPPPAPEAVAPPAAPAPVEAVVAAPVEPPPSAPAPPPPAGFSGEAPVDPAWLQQRESALQGIRADYEAARSAAQASVGGPGWQPATTVTDESGHPQNASGRPMTFVADPNSPRQIVAYDESGPVYGPPGGTWFEFDEAGFAAQYRAQAGAPLQTLAGLYGTDVGSLFVQHPELWTLATSDHALNDGPPPPGHAMGDPSQLGTLDLYLSDPQIQSLIAAYGGEPAPATGPLAQEQVRIYGAQRYAQMTRLGTAMQAVRDDYARAYDNAQRNGGPGWSEQPRTVMVSDESGPLRPMVITDESGAPLMARVFDPDAFTAWYEQQPGLANQAFKDFYGASHTTWGSDESGAQAAVDVRFDNPNWSMSAGGGGLTQRDLVGIDPNHPPRLNDDRQVGFDLEAGWATPHGNIHQSRDWFETLVQVAIIGGVSYLSAGTLGPSVAGAMGLTTGVGAGATLTLAGTMVSAAVAGAAASAVSGALNGNLSFKGIVQGALAGGLSAGLMSEYGAAVSKAYGTVGTVALRTTVQGGIQALLGGDFKDGALAGFASGLADVTAQSLNESIQSAVNSGTMDASQAFAARQFTRVLGSAIRVASNPNDPGAAFASSYLDSVLGETDPAGLRNNPETPGPYVPQAPEPALAPPAPAPLPPAEAAQPPAADVPVEAAPPEPTPAAPTPSETPPADAQPTPEPSAPAPDPSGAPVPPAFDDEGNLMPGVVDPSAPAAEQRQQLLQRLLGQGLSLEEANAAADRYFPSADGAAPDPADASQRSVVAQKVEASIQSLADQYGGLDNIPAGALKEALAPLLPSADTADRLPPTLDPTLVADAGGTLADLWSESSKGVAVAGGVIAGLFQGVGDSVIGLGQLALTVSRAAEYLSYGGEVGAGALVPGGREAYDNVVRMADAVKTIASDPARYLGALAKDTAAKVLGALDTANASGNLSDWFLYGAAVGRVTFDVAGLVLGAAGLAEGAATIATRLRTFVELQRAAEVLPVASTLGPTASGRSGLAALAEMTGVDPAATGGINATKINSTGYSLIDYSPAERTLALQIASEGDPRGAMTERLVESIAARQNMESLPGGKYGSNNGFDHVLVDETGHVTILLESKQMNDGTIALDAAGAGGLPQMSSEWVQQVLQRLDPSSPASRAVRGALEDGTLVKGIAAVDKTTGRLTIVRLN